MKKIYDHLYVRVILVIKRLGIRFLPKGTNYHQFVILCTARTGSTWLHTLLNSHLHIHSQGEIVRSNHENQKLPFQKFAFGPYPRFIHAVGLKVFYDATIYQEALRYVVANKQVKVILLTRKSAIDQFVSYKKALDSDLWSYSASQGNAKLKVDPAEFTTFQLTIKKSTDEVKSQLKDHVVFSLNYEELLTNQDSILEELQSFLSAPHRKLRSLLKRQSTVPIGEQIENWEEIKNQL